MARVLIIDDDAQIRELWSDVLSEWGFDVCVAASGQRGIEIAKSEPIDVVVTDMIMQEKDGIETLLEIKAVRPQAKVLVVSGGGKILNRSFVKFANRLGADATMQKPVDIEHFCHVVAELAGDG